MQSVLIGGIFGGKGPVCPHPETRMPPLTDIAIRKAKPSAKAVKMADGGGLYLEVSPSGGKLWRQKYRWGGKEKRLSHGVYPNVSLSDARLKRDEAKRLLAAGIDPGVQKQLDKVTASDRAGNTFESVAREWFAKQQGSWVAGHASKILLRLQNDIFPYLGARPISEISPRELLAIVNKVVDRGAVESAHRVLQNCGQIFRYAIVTGRAETNPAADLRGALPPTKVVHLAAITDPVKIGPLLRALDAYKGTPIVRAALKLAPLVFVRPGELRNAEWAEFDLSGEAPQWNVPAERMKMKEPHIVPLPSQAVAVLEDLKLLTGSGRYVFPGARSRKRPMSDNAILAALRRMEFAKTEMSGHGFRAMARTVLDEVLNFRPDIIEHQLAHEVKDPNGRAYNRTAHLPERRKMMQAWADYLDKLKAESESKSES